MIRAKSACQRSSCRRRRLDASSIRLLFRRRIPEWISRGTSAGTVEMQTIISRRFHRDNPDPQAAIQFLSSISSLANRILNDEM